MITTTTSGRVFLYDLTDPDLPNEEISARTQHFMLANGVTIPHGGDQVYVVGTSVTPRVQIYSGDQFTIPFSYAALGDSYSSGEGIPRWRAVPWVRPFPFYLPLTDVPWPNLPVNLCHRSSESYPYLLRIVRGLPLWHLAQAAPTLFGYTSRACSGAETRHVDSVGQYPVGPPDDVKQEVVVNAATSVVTISIGGNDAHFAEVVKACVFVPGDCRHQPSLALGQTWEQYLPSHINGTVRAAVKSVLTDLEASGADQVLVLDYPRLVEFPGCAAATGLTLDDALFMRQIATLLNQMIAQEVDDRGPTVELVPVSGFFESPDPAQSHLVCSPDPWVNWIAFADAGSWLHRHKKSFHPNRRGQKAMAKLVTLRMLLP